MDFNVVEDKIKNLNINTEEWRGKSQEEREEENEGRAEMFEMMAEVADLKADVLRFSLINNHKMTYRWKCLRRRLT